MATEVESSPHFEEQLINADIPSEPLLASAALPGDDKVAPTEEANSVVQNLLDFGGSEPSSTTDAVEDIPSPNLDSSYGNEVSSSTAEEPVSVEDKEEIKKTETVEATLTSLQPKSADKELRSPLALFLVKQNVSPAVMSLIYWKKLHKTASVFGGVLFILLSLYWYSLINVITTFALALLVVSFLYRIGMTIVNAVQKTSAEHPFKNLLEERIELSENAMKQIATVIRNEINCSIKSLQSLFLIEDVFQSLKFGVVLWLVSYIGSWFSPLTITVLCVISVFTIPKLYEEKQVQIDQIIVIGCEKVKMVFAGVEAKVPPKIKAYFNKNKTD